MTALTRLFQRHGLSLNRVEPLAIHGGSLRLFVEKRERMDRSVAEHLRAEQRDGHGPARVLRGILGRESAGSAASCVALLGRLQREGARIAGYGAAAKGTILLNFAGIGQEVLEFVADRNVHKQGRYIPGVRLPIVAPERILAQQPDYLLILPWNFKDEIMEQQAEFRRRGGRFIVPVPEPVVV